MTVYAAPLKDFEKLLSVFCPKEENLPVLEEGARFALSKLLPLNASGDREGCSLKDGKVKTPAGFKEAYADFVKDGWAGLAVKEKDGGANLSLALYALWMEMLSSANTSFSLTVGLTYGAYHVLEEFGDETLKEKYLKPLGSGEYAGAMDMTEANAGSDLSLIESTARKNEDGSYDITGTKIFITAGDHDLTKQIIHLVLAKTSAGISLFLVPKLLEDGSENGVKAIGIEHKMGIHASPTCTMRYKNAKGYLIYKEGRGLLAMFSMMNTERYLVGTQALGLAEIAYQNGLVYAQERLQGRSVGGIVSPDKPADPLISHPNVKKDLDLARAEIIAGRALMLFAASADENVFQFMIPVIKAGLTDMSFKMTNTMLGIFGGHGYITETGMEQFVRDGRIAQIYEGSNDIQAQDLLLRKAYGKNGLYLDAFLKALPLENESEMRNVTKQLLEKSKTEQVEKAKDYLAMVFISACLGVYRKIAALYPEETRVYRKDKILELNCLMEKLKR